MAFRRRFSRRRRFGGRAVARKEPIWITTAYNVPFPPFALRQELFQLVGPEDYSPDYVTETNRKDRCTLVRTVGHFLVIPAVPADPDGSLNASWKAALFVAGDKQIDDAFSADPNQFDITAPLVFPPFCRDYSPMKIFWSSYLVDNNVTLAAVPNRYPPSETGQREWDVTVKRKLVGDDALWLLINIAAISSDGEAPVGAALDVESRNLIMDQ